MKETFKLDDTTNKDVSFGCEILSDQTFTFSLFQLHFLVGSETVSCHQSMMIPYSKFLRSLLRDRISRAGVPDISIILPDVKMSTVKSLLEYIYTGKTNINKIKEVNEIDSLRRLLQMKISIDKKIYPLDKHKHSSRPRAEAKPDLPQVKSRQSDRKPDQLPSVVEKSPVKESTRKSTEKVVLKAEKEPVAVAPAVIKKEKGLNNSSDEEKAQRDPYSLSVEPLKLRVKLEAPPEPEQTAEETNDLLGSSMFERILKSISGEKELGEEEEAGGPYEAAREEMVRPAEEEEESEESGSDSGSDSDSSDSSSDDSDSEEDSVPQVRFTLGY